MRDRIKFFRPEQSEILQVMEAVSAGFADPIDENSHNQSSIVEDCFIKSGRAVAHSAKKECFYLGVLAALSKLGEDECMSQDDRIVLARKMSVEARSFLVQRNIIDPPCWLGTPEVK